jgi:gluconate 2-dehydrogenase gamma chain
MQRKPPNPYTPSVPSNLTSSQLVALRCVLDRVIPGDDLTPGAGEAGGAEYIDRLLGAFNFDPPQIWAGGPTSGRRGGAAAFDHWIEMGEWEKLAWRTRIDQWSLVYEAGLLALGDDFVELSPDQQTERLKQTSTEFRSVLYEHGCESLYGDPIYGGNRDAKAWQAIDYRGDVQPEGYTDQEVSAP